VPPSELSPIPRRKTRLFGARDLRVAAVDRALAGDIAALSALRAAPAQAPVPPSISRACVALRHRQDREQYGPYEGILTSPAARAALQKRFGPDQTLSASRLEEYATCPYRFWLTTVLGIRPPAEIGVEEDFRERGQLLHGAMAAAHRSLNEAAQRPVLPTGEFSQQFILGFRQALEAILETIARDNPWEAALRAVDHQLLSDLVERYIDHFAEYADEHGQSLHPAHFEVAFGLPDDGQGAPTTIGPLNVGDGNDAVKLCGRIDRVDLGNAGGRPVFGVVDYKSGKSNRYRPNKDGSINPSLMQLEIYALAVEQLLLTDAAPAGCGYWFVREKGYKSWIDYRDKPDAAPAKDWERRKAKLITTIVNLVRAIRDGQFPIHNDDHDCSGSCEFHKTCRVNHARSLEKTWQPVDLTTKTRRHEEDSE
jgi:RecB family exonuclease